MRYLLPILFLALFAEAGILDFMTLKQADRAYAAKEYKKAAELYGKIAEEGSEEARFNAADALYKVGDYEKALKLYQTISSSKLLFEKLHNIGNCYAKMGKIDEAIEAYEKALRLKEDKDTRFNLELMKKMKKRRQNHQNQKNEKKQNRQKSGSQKDSTEHKDKKGSESGENSKHKNGKDGENGEEKKKKKEQKGEKSQKRKTAENKEQRSGERTENTERFSGKEEPISDMEVRKWNKELNRRGIHTLMLPLPTESSKRSYDETNPW